MSRSQFFRKWVAPILLFGGIALIGFDTCHKGDRTHTTIVLDFGDARPRVKQVDATLIVEGDPIADIHRRALPGAKIDTPRFEAAMPDKDAELHIDVLLDDGQRSFVRHVHAIEGGTVTVPLASDLR